MFNRVERLCGSNLASSPNPRSAVAAPALSASRAVCPAYVRWERLCFSGAQAQSECVCREPYIDHPSFANCHALQKINVEISWRSSAQSPHNRFLLLLSYFSSHRPRNPRIHNRIVIHSKTHDAHACVVHHSQESQEHPRHGQFHWTQSFTAKSGG